MSTIEELKTIANAKFGFARNNQFMVELPPIGQGGGFGGFLGSLLPLPSVPGLIENAPSTRDMNILCSQVTLPGKQILTSDRRVGMESSKVAYGYAVPEVNMTFYLMNDYGVKNYFDAWHETILNEEIGTVGYRDKYEKRIVIHQLRKPLTGFSKNVGPLNLNLGLGGGSVYSCALIDAFPTTVNGIDLSNDLDGLVQLQVSFSYTRWKSKEIELNAKQLFDFNIGL
jgi:hypothetical protein